MAVSIELYERIALEDPESSWELVDCGYLRRKPPMSQEHNSGQSRLGYLLQSQLSFDAYEVRQNSARLQLVSGRYFVPDICVIPVSAMHPPSPAPSGLETYVDPLPLVVEIWSPSTGDYDVDTKFPQYLERGDLEVWRIHPYERTLTAWVRQPDGTYTESLHRSGVVALRHLPGVTVDFAALFR